MTLPNPSRIFLVICIAIGASSTFLPRASGNQDAGFESSPETAMDSSQPNEITANPEAGPNAEATSPEETTRSNEDSIETKSPDNTNSLNGIEIEPKNGDREQLADTNPSASESLSKSIESTGVSKLDSESQDTTVWLNLPTNTLLGCVLAVLGIATLVGRLLTRRENNAINSAMLRKFVLRIRAWWLMCAMLVIGLLLHRVGTVALFFFLSFWALREFITMTPTRRGDHRALFYSLVVFTPLQYILIALGSTSWEWHAGRRVDFYGLYSIMIPVYASLFIPARIAFAGDHKRFLERAAQIQAGLLVCVYSLSYAPALLYLELARPGGERWTGSNAGLLFFFVLISQLADVFQWTWGQLAGRRVIAKEISSSRTWEAFVGGSLSTGIVGALLYWVTPFQIWEAAVMSILVAMMGFAGGMTMSAIKRDRGVNDYGSLVVGHAGVLDRIDTLCFSAPVFYHLTRFFFAV